MRGTILPLVLLALMLTPLVLTDCHAQSPEDCIACWRLKGVLVSLRDGTTIKGYAIWNDNWAALGLGSYGEKQKQGPEIKIEFPKVIFDPRAKIPKISVYTHLRSIKYPVANGLVTLRDPVQVNAEDIKDLKLNPGPHDGYKGAGRLPIVSERIADLLQTKPSASCHYDEGAGDMYWVSYDKSFAAEKLQRLCEEHNSDEELEKKLKARDIFSLYHAYD
ncbi:MAG: hypothetical protein HY913_04635 [Desulfomonile tiedjei]|nr:hypothetical protein [Desulfomonile tiedjei]